MLLPAFLLLASCTLPDGCVNGVGPGCEHCLPGFSGAGCVACSPGTFKSAYGKSAACEACPPGTYQALEGQSSCVSCAQAECCPAGYGFFGETCVLCPAGTFSSAGASCLPCRDNAYSPAGASACTCAPGFYGREDCLPCTQCEVYASTCGGGLDDAVCLRCEPPTVLVNGACVCQAGTAAAGCAPCAANTFAASAGMLACEPCPSTAPYALPGAKGCSSSCADGYVLQWPGVCAACPSGMSSSSDRTRCLPSSSSSTVAESECVAS